MILEKQQEFFDNLKWQASAQTGGDLCGTCDFCKVCIKNESYPCARAEQRYNGGRVRVAVVRKKRFIGGF